MTPTKKTSKAAPKSKAKVVAKATTRAKPSAARSSTEGVRPRSSRSEVITPAKAPILMAAPPPVAKPVAPPSVPSAVARGTQEGRYVYGIIESNSSETFGKSGIGGAGEIVYTVNHGDVAAVVSRTSVFIFDPTRENALAHEHVIETVMKTNTIIPMSFGTVFRTDDDIKEVLKSIYPSLKDVLKQMAGKLEFGLKVTWDRERVIEELKRDHEEIHRFHMELTRKHLQSTYFARMQLGRMIDKALAERAADYVREIYDALRSICVASRDNKPIGDKMIMNAAFLLQREREADFDAAVNKVAQKFSDRLNFKYTGPWPPYNFVNIRLKLERGTAS